MFDFARRHPIWAAIIGVIVFVVIYLAISGGSSSGSDYSAVTGGYDPNADAAGVALAQQQTQLQAIGLQTAAGLEASRVSAQNNVDLATIAATVKSQELNITGQVANATLAMQQALGTSTIQAQLEATRISADSQNRLIQSLVDQAQINADVSKAAIKANSKKGLFSKIFG